MLIIEMEPDTHLEHITEQMGRTPPWTEGLILSADGYCTQFYKKRLTENSGDVLSSSLFYICILCAFIAHYA